MPPKWVPRSVYRLSDLFSKRDHTPVYVCCKEAYRPGEKNKMTGSTNGKFKPKTKKTEADISLCLILCLSFSFFV